MDPAKKEKFGALGKKLVGLAPFIAGMLGGPAVGAGAKVITDFLGVNDSDDPEVLEGIINTLPVEKILELKKLDADLRAQEAAIETNLQDNLTRRLESDNATNSKFVQFLRPSLAVFWSLVTAVIIAIGLWSVDPERIDFYNAALLASGSVVGAIIAFYFGGRSAEKIAAIKRPTVK